MNFDEMILAHSRWKSRLRASIQGTENIDAQAVGKDDQCDLGRWLLGEGRTHANLAEFGELKAKHARFHTTVAQVVTQAKELPTNEALRLVESLDSDYARASSACINAIAKLRKTIG